MRPLFCLLLLTTFAASAAAQHTGHHAAPSPYAGETERSLKALAPEEVTGLLEGQGMGLARSAELNHYPGPLHVLELAAELGLTERQRAETQALRDGVKRDAMLLGQRIVERERELDALFAGGQATDAAVGDLTAAIGALQGALRAVHLVAHVRMRAVLTPEQVARYDALRGYASDAAPGGATPGGAHHHR